MYYILANEILLDLNKQNTPHNAKCFMYPVVDNDMHFTPPV